MTTTLARFTMTDELVKHDAGQMAVLGQMADAYARLGVFEEADREISDNTRTAHLADLRTFSEFLSAAGMDAPPTGDELRTTPQAWTGITYGLVKAFREWMLQRGFAMATVNRKLSTVRKYARMAAEADAVDTDTLAKIRLVSGKTGKAAMRIDKDRESTRVSTKRTHEDMVALDEAQRKALKAACDVSTPQGRRDAVLVCLLMDHGLRVGEACGLTVDNVNLKEGKFTFFREKVNLTQTHKMSAATLVAMRAYFDAGDAPALGALLRGSRKGGKLTHAGMSTTAASARITELARLANDMLEKQGEELRLPHVSAHDMRHTWTTEVVHKYPNKLHIIQEAGGWSSERMLRRYTKPLAVANESINISL